MIEEHEIIKSVAVCCASDLCKILKITDQSTFGCICEEIRRDLTNTIQAQAEARIRGRAA